jgi:hypothetical protein
VISKTKLTSSFLPELNFANPFVIAVAKKKMCQWLDATDSPL